MKLTTNDDVFKSYQRYPLLDQSSSQLQKRRSSITSAPSNWQLLALAFFLLKVAAEDATAVIRSRLVVGQEMAASYAVYQNRVADLKASVECEYSMAR